MRFSRVTTTLTACAAAVGAVVAVGIGVVGVVGVGPASAGTVICDQYGSTTIGSQYVVMNNNWGDTSQQCITVTSTGFSITTASHNKALNGPPGSYPAVYYGCHYNNCSPGTKLPKLASAETGITTSVGMTYPGSGTYDASYDIWYDPTARKDGQNTGVEVMVWLNKVGNISPIGSLKYSNVSIAGATWNVWEGVAGSGPNWNVVSFVRTSSSTSASFKPSDLFNYSVTKGWANSSWYLTSIQAGFEPWVGGVGLGVNSFSVTGAS